jgi:hypothetical protein
VDSFRANQLTLLVRCIHHFTKNRHLSYNHLKKQSLNTPRMAYCLELLKYSKGFSNINFYEKFNDALHMENSCLKNLQKA